MCHRRWPRGPRVHVIEIDCVAANIVVNVAGNEVFNMTRSLLWEYFTPVQSGPFSMSLNVVFAEYYKPEYTSRFLLKKMTAKVAPRLI